MQTSRSSTRVRSIDPPAYATRAEDDAATIAAALAILDARVRTGPIFSSPQEVKNYARIYFAPHSSAHREVFACLWLDPQHRLISTEAMFHGTLSQTSVYPREVVKRALELGAGAVILAHNHPSGSTEPSRADEQLTTTLKAALQLVDVRVLDHLVVGNPTTVSFAERGLL